MRRRRAILLAVPVGIIALIVGLRLGSSGSDGATPEQQGPTAAEIHQAKVKERARENKAIDRVLDYTTFVKEGGGQKRQVALTFDDGPGVYTPGILRTLKRTNTPATFFVVGSMVPGEEKMIKRIVRQGHAIGNHTLDHAGMGSLGAAEQVEQVSRQAALIDGVGVPEQRLFRPPYRSFNASTLELLAERDLLMVLWSIDTGDYEGLPATEIARRALEEVKPGSIILMHDAGGDRTETAKALPEIIKGLKRRNLKPVTVPRLVLDDPPIDGQRLPDGLSGN